MRESRRTWNSGMGWTIISLSAIILLLPILEIARPGCLFCPLRRLAKKAGIDKFDPPANMILLYQASEQELDGAKTLAKTWKEKAIDQFPNLHIEKHQVPPEKNGYWQFYQLIHGPIQPSDSLNEFREDKKPLDSEKVRAILAENESWGREIEHIAELTQTSQTDEGDNPSTSPIPEMELIKAHRFMLLKALMAAEAKDEAEVLRCMMAAKNLNNHFQNLDDPKQITESVNRYLNESWQKFMMERLLPMIGQSADLKRWHQAMVDMKKEPTQLATALRGEWHESGSTFEPLLLIAHERRMLIDPKNVAIAYAQALSQHIAQLETSTLPELVHGWKRPASSKKLSPEGEAVMAIIHDSLDNRLNQYLTAARNHACYQAAIELLMMKPCLGDLSAEDADQVTHDPLTGKPFVFDPKENTLSSPDELPRYKLKKPVKLPW